MMRVLLPVILGLSVLLGGCGLFHFDGGSDRWAEVRPIQLTTELSGRTANPYYDRATAAITRRDYARALDLLQRARARDASDIRVLNAFGVVYDKLGRFDLSTRYYSQALLLDPGSTVVARNLAYSRQLQDPAQDTMMASAAGQGPGPEPVALRFAATAPPGAMPAAPWAEPTAALSGQFGCPSSALTPAPRLPAPIPYSACTTSSEGVPVTVPDDVRTARLHPSTVGGDQRPEERA